MERKHLLYAACAALSEKTHFAGTADGGETSATVCRLGSVYAEAGSGGQGVAQFSANHHSG